VRQDGIANRLCFKFALLAGGAVTVHLMSKLVGEFMGQDSALTLAGQLSKHSASLSVAYSVLDEHDRHPFSNRWRGLPSHTSPKSAERAQHD